MNKVDKALLDAYKKLSPRERKSAFNRDRMEGLLAQEVDPVSKKSATIWAAKFESSNPVAQHPQPNQKIVK